jgi:GT2 family glycosyltransferase
MPEECAAPTLTVVVMGYRNEATIVEAVRSVVEQVTPEVEVLVVTSGGDRSGERVRRAFPTLPVHEADHRLMPGGARNLGLRHSCGDHVSWLAADCLAAPGWVDARIDAHRAGHPAVAASVTDSGRPLPWSRASHLLQYRTRLPGLAPAAVPPGDPRCHGLSIARLVVDEVGPFDEVLRVGEDSDMARRLLRHGVAIRFEPEVVVVHRGPRTPWHFVVDEWTRARRSRPPDLGPGRRRRRTIWSELRACVAAGVRSSGGPTWVVVMAAPWIVVGLVVRRIARRWPDARRPA